MTKMPVTVAALQQVEQGRLDLDAPVADYCPQFADVQVLTGLGYWLFSDLLVRWEQVTGVPNVVAGSSARSPPRCWPTRARRSSTASTSTGSAGSSRRSPAPGLDVEGITGPLGMSQTTFSMTGEQRPNCTPPGEAAPRWPR